MADTHRSESGCQVEARGGPGETASDFGAHPCGALSLHPSPRQSHGPQRPVPAVLPQLQLPELAQGQRRHLELGRDTGYGFGWRLLAGSITPYYSTLWALDHYTFTDATGAEYRLDVNTNGVWTSQESGIYLSYDSATSRLWFNDGSFWQMDAVSGGLEEDASARYPTLYQDSNGNQIKIRYQTGQSAPAANTSGRIVEIEDVRTPQGQTYSHQFTYANGHLYQVTNTIGSKESYTFAFAAVTLKDPFELNWLGNGSTLTSMTFDASSTLKYQFAYDTAGAAELQKVTLPLGAELGWTYKTWTFNSSHAFREVQTRTLKPDSASATTWTHTVWRPSGDTGRMYHYLGSISDGSGLYDKGWWFETNASSPYAGFTTKYAEREFPSETELLRKDFTWTPLPAA